VEEISRGRGVSEEMREGREGREARGSTVFDGGFGAGVAHFDNWNPR
jgi:hypothetical protein